jgi:hypothetical protein
LNGPFCLVVNPAAADGDTLPSAALLRAGTPLRIRALPGALRVLVPA